MTEIDAAELARLREYFSAALKTASPSETWWARKAFSLIDALEKEQREASALAADQCADGYGDEYGNHACKVVDAMRAERDSARALLQECVDDWIPEDCQHIRARIAKEIG